MSDTREWVVTYKARQRHAHVEIWARIVGVPAELVVEDVSTALELWDRWPQWQARTSPGSVVNVRPLRANDDVERASIVVLTWSTLAPTSRRVQVELAGAVYAAARRAARMEGSSLAQWVIAAIAAAAAVEVEDVDAHRAPAFVDVPLPGVG